jgi:hypothetical protein
MQKIFLIIIVIVSTNTQLSADWLTCKEQAKILKKYNRTKYLGGKRKMVINPKTYQISYTTEYGKSGMKTLSIRFRNRTNIVFKNNYKIFPSYGSSSIEPGSTRDITERTQIEYLLKCNYRIKKVFENHVPVYEFFQR